MRRHAGGVPKHPCYEALTLDLPERARVRSALASGVTITLNGDPYPLDAPVSVAALLVRLGIDSRRVAVEHNQVVVRRAHFETTIVGEGDQVEVVNFVGGGAAGR
jgi:sulfur carrier protein